MKAYTATLQSDHGPKQIFIIQFGKIQVNKDHRSVNFVGLQSATLTTWEAIKIFKPDLVINPGTAGGRGNKGAGIGDVYVTNGLVKYHDRRIPIPGYKEFGIGNFPTLTISPDIVEKLKLKSGIFSSGNSLSFEGHDCIQFDENEAVVKDMETAAIAEVCQLKNLPMIAVRGITDLLELPSTVEDFLANLEMVVNKVAVVLPDLLISLLGKKIKDISC